MHIYAYRHTHMYAVHTHMDIYLSVILHPNSLEGKYFLSSAEPELYMAHETINLQYTHNLSLS
jgi:hypothetical protein